MNIKILVYSILFFLLMSNHSYSKSINNNSFGVTVLSATIVPVEDTKAEYLLLVLEISNNTSKKLSFFHPSIYRQLQPQDGWDLILTKDNREAAWQLNNSFITEYPQIINIKKNKRITLEYYCLLEDLVGFDSLERIGKYTVQIELTNIEDKRGVSETIKSNIFEFEIIE